MNDTSGSTYWANDWASNPQSPTELARAAAEAIREGTGVDRHDVALVLGSGWLPAVDALGETTAELTLSDLPGFAPPAVAGTPASCARCAPATATCWSSSAAPTSTRAAGCARSSTASAPRRPPAAATVVLTNGCGGLRETWSPGHPGADQRPHQPDRDQPHRGRELRRPHRPVLPPAAGAVQGGRPVARRGCLRAVPRPALRDPGRDRHGPGDGRPPGRHVHGARGDRRPGGRARGARHLAGDQPGGRASPASRSTTPRCSRPAAPRRPGWATCSARSCPGSSASSRPDIMPPDIMPIGHVPAVAEPAGQPVPHLEIS